MKETDARKLARAKAKLICVQLFTFSVCYNGERSMGQIKSGICRYRFNQTSKLFRTLATTQLEKCNSVDEYVNEIIITAYKLSGLGFQVSDEWISTLLIEGLPDEYKPMIMNIESSGTAITADSIKTKILRM